MVVTQASQIFYDPNHDLAHLLLLLFLSSLHADSILLEMMAGLVGAWLYLYVWPLLMSFVLGCCFLFSARANDIILFGLQVVLAFMPL